MRWSLLAIAFLAVPAACSGDQRADSKPASSDAVLAAWQQAGLQPTAELVAADGAALGGGQCRAGVISGLEVTLCEYADDAAAAKAQPAGQARIGDATGAAVASGRLLLVVADRHKSDPNGKTIDKLTRTFQRGPGSAKEPAK